MVKTTNFEVLLPVYWRDAIEKALKRSIDDDISTVFLRVKRRINVRNVIENALKRGLEKSRIDDEYFHSVADGAKQGFLDYAYKKFKDVKETKGISEDKNYAIVALTNEFLIRGNNYFRMKNQDSYLFSWDEISENNYGRFIDFLKKKYDIDWAKKGTIEKIDDNKTIRVLSEKSSLSLRLNDEKTKVNLTIDNGRTDKLIGKTENSKLNIYGQDLTQYEKAIENYDKVIEINPNFIEAYINRAIAKNRLDLYEDAIKDLEHIIKVNPDNVHAYISLGVNYTWLGNRDRAFSCYEKAMKLNSEDPLPYYNRAMLYEEIREHENAEKDYEMAIKLKPDFDEAYYKIVFLLEEMGKCDKAKVYYEKMIKLKFGLEAMEN
jgi:tetratricopeptide (TPR) repeat protein